LVLVSTPSLTLRVRPETYAFRLSGRTLSVSDGVDCVLRMYLIDDCGRIFPLLYTSHLLNLMPVEWSDIVTLGNWKSGG
jgi:hypothetical protein